MQFKEGSGWKACFDEERDLYTAQVSNRGFYALSEIDKEAFDKLGTDGVDDLDAYLIIRNGRTLFETNDEPTTMPSYRVRDERYQELAPWSSAERIAVKTDALNKRCAIANRFPGLSLAYRNTEGRISSMYFGASDLEDSKPVNGDIVFPACSISKFITSICVMKMHEMKTIDIDEPVNKYLISWKLLTPDGAESDAAVRSLLNHTAGIIDGEDSFHGLRIGGPEVSLTDILEGRTKYNNRPSREEKPHGTSFEYSDAGYCILQLMMEEATGKAFEDTVQEMLFDKLGLKDIFYATPANIEKNNRKMAAGYSEDNTPIDGKYPVIPDLAASGLWCTPKSLIMIAEEFLKALNGDSSVLQKGSALEMIKPAKDFPWTGLGIFLDGADILVSNGWGENGQCMMKIYKDKGEISAVMTNMDPGVDQKESGIEWLVDSYTYFI